MLGGPFWDYQGERKDCGDFKCCSFSGCLGLTARIGMPGLKMLDAMSGSMEICLNGPTSIMCNPEKQWLDVKIHKYYLTNPQGAGDFCGWDYGGWKWCRCRDKGCLHGGTPAPKGWDWQGSTERNVQKIFWEAHADLKIRNKYQCDNKISLEWSETKMTYPGWDSTCRKSWAPVWSGYCNRWAKKGSLYRFYIQCYEKPTVTYADNKVEIIQHKHGGSLKVAAVADALQAHGNAMMYWFKDNEGKEAKHEIPIVHPQTRQPVTDSNGKQKYKLHPTCQNQRATWDGKREGKIVLTGKVIACVPGGCCCSTVASGSIVVGPP